MSALKKKLQDILVGEVLDDNDSLKFYSKDASIFEVRPNLVVLPKDVEDIKRLVKFVSQSHTSFVHKFKNLFSPTRLHLTARAAGTDMTGGPLSQGIVVDLNKHLNQIEEVGKDWVRVQPGTYYLDLEKELLKHNLLLPSYPSSRAICAVGGMVGNNAGGEKTLYWGKTDKYVTELSVVLRDGNEYQFSALSEEELKKKIEKKDLEGEIYKKVYDLVDKNYVLIQSHRPKVSKNSSGYYLWNVWDQDKKIFDLTKLIVGSQGTLGIVTDIKFKLVTPKKYTKLLVIFLNDSDKLGEIVNKVLKFKPESFEFYDDQTLKYAIQYFPEIVEYIKKTGKPHQDLKKLYRYKATLMTDHPKLTLLAQFAGDTQKEIKEAAIEAQKSLDEYKLTTEICESEEEAEEFWAVRRESYNLLRFHAKNKAAAPFIEDIIVRPEQLPEFLPELDEIFSHYKILYTVAGHIGDAHFHIIPLMNMEDPKTRQIILELSEKVFNLVIKYEGSIAGEHDDGLSRSPYVEKMFGSEMMELFREVKNIFDPKEIFNPGKKVYPSLDFAIRHLKKNS